MNGFIHFKLQYKIINKLFLKKILYFKIYIKINKNKKINN